MRKKLGIIAIGAALALTLAGCTGGSAGASGTAEDKAPTSGEVKGEITFQTWSLKNDRFTPYFEKVISDFEKANPGTKIKWIDQPGDGYEDKILQQANANELPDVINLPPEFAFKLAKVNLLEDLNTAAPGSLDDYVDGSVKAYQYEGITGSFAYPWYLGTDLNWWNTAELKEAGVDITKLPTNNDELFAMAKTVAKNTGGKIKLISESPRMGTLSSSGVKVFENGKFVFNTPKAAALIDQYKEAYKEGAMPPEALSGNYLGNSALYKQGKVAWTVASAGFASELTKEAPSIKETTINSPRIGASPLFIQGISVAKNSKAKPLALAFAKFVTNNQNQVDFVKIAQGFFPGTKEGNSNPSSFTSVIENDLQKKATEIAAAAIGTAYPEYPIQFTYAMDTYLKQQVALAVRGDITSQEALDRAVKYANENMVK